MSSLASDPENFVEDNIQGRHLTFRLCVYEGSKVNAELTVTDPGGATRTFTLYLPDDKSAVLVTASPAGGGYVPETRMVRRRRPHHHRLTRAAPRAGCGRAMTRTATRSRGRSCDPPVWILGTCSRR